MLNAITIDVEDYFHPSEVQASVSPDRWDSMTSRVERATDRCLDLLARHQTKGTFFILGWVARKSPELVRRIAEAGHEIACHSFWHRLVYDLTPGDFRQDTVDAVDAIESACGVRPTAYRAPSYSTTRKSWWALDVLASLGFTHDSSVFPIVHDRYGVPGYSRAAVVEQTPSGLIFEVPRATAKVWEIADPRFSPRGSAKNFPGVGDHLALAESGDERVSRTPAVVICFIGCHWSVVAVRRYARHNGKVGCGREAHGAGIEDFLPTGRGCPRGSPGCGDRRSSEFSHPAPPQT